MIKAAATATSANGAEHRATSQVHRAAVRSYIYVPTVSILRAMTNGAFQSAGRSFSSGKRRSSRRKACRKARCAAMAVAFASWQLPAGPWPSAAEYCTFGSPSPIELKGVVVVMLRDGCEPGTL